MSKWAMWAHLDVYVPRSFQWYKECRNPLSFDPWNRFLKFWESTRIPSPKVGVALGVWGFTPSHFPTLPGVCDVTPRLSFSPHPCNPFTLVASPKLGLWQSWFTILHIFEIRFNVANFACQSWFFSIIINYYKWNRATKIILLFLNAWHMKKIKTFIFLLYCTMFAPPLYMITIHTNGVIIFINGHHY